MKLIVTIDTEEDNWARYSAVDNPVSNIEKIIPLQKLFDKFRVRPTYLVSYPVATNQRSVTILKKIMEQDKCEIGAHCHPWNTPPFDANEKILEHNTMLINLNEDLQYAKLSSLHEAIQDNFQITPVSFRAGRFGFGLTVARSLIKLGYRIDTSVTPFVNWEHYHGPDLSEFEPGLFKFSFNNFFMTDQTRSLLEVPVTIGFLQANFQLCRRFEIALEKPLPRKLHIAGILERLRLLNKVWLSPEMTDARDMIKLAKQMKKNKYSILNLTFHSTSLQRGLSPFVQSQSDEIDFFKRLENFLVFARNIGCENCILSDLY